MTRLVLIATLLTAACGSGDAERAAAARAAELEARVKSLEAQAEAKADSKRRVAAAAGEMAALEAKLVDLEIQMARTAGEVQGAKNRIEWAPRSADPKGAEAEARRDLSFAEARLEIMRKERRALLAEIERVQRGE